MAERAQRATTTGLTPEKTPRRRRRKSRDCVAHTHIFQRTLRGAYLDDDVPVVFASLDHRLISIVPPGRQPRCILGFIKKCMIRPSFPDLTTRKPLMRLPALTACSNSHTQRSQGAISSANLAPFTPFA